MRKYTQEEKAAAKVRDTARRKKWREDNRELHSARLRNWRKANPEKARQTLRRAQLKLWYGVTPEWVDATIVAQRGCAICKVEDAVKRGGWHVDHDHSTGKTRGVLCGHCNRGMGFLKDDSEICAAAAEYLRFHRRIDVQE
jgi:hypothetical protein